MEESIKEDMKRQDKIEQTRLSYSAQKESSQVLLVFGLQSKKQNLRHSKLHENEQSQNHGHCYRTERRSRIICTYSNCSMHFPDKKLILEEAFQSMNSQLYLVTYSLLTEACIIVLKRVI